MHAPAHPLPRHPAEAWPATSTQTTAALYPVYLAPSSPPRSHAAAPALLSVLVQEKLAGHGGMHASLSNQHLLLAEERRVGSGRQSPDAADFGRRMSISNDAWPPSAAHFQPAPPAASAAHAGVFSVVPSAASLQPLQQHEWKQFATAPHSPVGTTPIALSYHVAPAVAATATATLPPTSASSSPPQHASSAHVPAMPISTRHPARSAQPQAQAQAQPTMYYHPTASSIASNHAHAHHAPSNGHLHAQAPPLKRTGGGASMGSISQACFTETCTTPVPPEGVTSLAAALLSPPAGALGGRAVSAPVQQHQQTPAFAHQQGIFPQASSNVFANGASYPHVVAQQLPLQLLDQSTHARPSYAPPSVLQSAEHSAPDSLCSSSLSSSQTSPSHSGVGCVAMADRMGFATLGMSHSSAQLSSGCQSSAISKSSSTTQLHQPEPLCVVTRTQHAYTVPSSANVSLVASREITPEPLRVLHEYPQVPASSKQGATHAPTSEDESFSQADVRASSDAAGTEAPGSVDSCGSVGSLNAAVATSTLDSPGAQAANAAGLSELSSAATLVRSVSSSSTCSSASARNANNKRCRAEREETATEAEAPVAGQQLKTSSTATASSMKASAQAEAQQAHREATTPPAAVAAPATAAPAPATTTEAPAPAATAAAPAAATAAVAASSASLLAPNTPKRQALISVLSCVLSQLFSNPNDTLPTDARLLTRFHTERLPSISIGSYLERIAHYSECSDETLVMAFIHISRVSHNKPYFHLNALSIHRLLLTAIMCTVKFYDDAYYNNAFYAKIGGVALREMNALEIDFLELIQFELYIDTKVYCRFYEELRNPVLHPKCACAYERMIDLNMDEMDNPPQI